MAGTLKALECLAGWNVDGHSTGCGYYHRKPFAGFFGVELLYGVVKALPQSPQALNLGDVVHLIALILL